MDAALRAVAADPLRETAKRSSIIVDLAEGNFVEAQRAFARFERIFRTDFGVKLSPLLPVLQRI